MLCEAFIKSDKHTGFTIRLYNVAFRLNEGLQCMFRLRNPKILSLF